MPLSLSLPEKVALAFTSLGSQRAVARDLGLSHQQVGRLLRAAQGIGPEQGGLAPRSRALQRPETVAAIEAGFVRHIERARAMAKSQSVTVQLPGRGPVTIKAEPLPFSAEVPIAYERLPMQLTERREVIDPVTGEITVRPVPVLDAKGKPVMVPGDRIAAKSTGWIPPRVREAWVSRLQKTDKFVNASVSSMVNLKRYLKRGEQTRDKSVPRTKKQAQFVRNMRKLLREADHDKIQRVFSTYTRMDAGFPVELMKDNLRQGIEKQAQALDEGSQGTLADQVLLQYRPDKVGAARGARDQLKTRKPGRGSDGRKAATRGRGARKG